MNEYNLNDRINLEEAQSISEKIQFDKIQLKIFDSIPNILLLLNSTRQVVYANDLLAKMLEVESVDEFIGKRPGEILNCNRAFLTDNGCGTSTFCATCGALKSILSSIHGFEDVQECRIIQEGTGNAFDLRVRTSPITVNDEETVIFSVEDIGNEKRRQVFERVFFHDIMNTAFGLTCLAELLEISLPNDYDEFKQYARQISERLTNEIKSQRQLMMAESGHLELSKEPINTIAIMKEIKDIYSKYDIAKDKEILIDENSVDFNFEADKGILGRVIANMLKNAIEATKANQTISLGCEKNADFIRFWVKNPTVMAEDVQKQIFQRSFSTKGKGRGIGTYSIKLLTEKYLKGNVGFSSAAGEGTTFFAEINSLGIAT
ncbi:MAG: HAMP domain-containing histidine kinase [Ignavibacteria bacterium]|nr:HAMP domain-containing histidine kinase [Ignavibacteria bacterium]